MSLDEFIARHGETVFPHSEELFVAARSGTCVLSMAPAERGSLPCRHFLEIFRFQVAHLSKLTTPQSPSLLADTAALIVELEKCPTEPCGVWYFAISPHYLFNVYESLPSKRILGCIKTVDRGLVDETVLKQS